MHSHAIKFPAEINSVSEKHEPIKKKKREKASNCMVECTYGENHKRDEQMTDDW